MENRKNTKKERKKGLRKRLRNGNGDGNERKKKKVLAGVHKKKTMELY